MWMRSRNYSSDTPRSRVRQERAFRDREVASKQLQQLGEGVAPHLTLALQDARSEEVKERIEKILVEIRQGTSPELSRFRKAISVLDWMATPAADEHLRQLATGDESSSLTQRAKAIIVGRAPPK